MKKMEWRKQFKNIYLPTKMSMKIELPSMKYFTVEGQGRPDSEAFQENVEVLYALSYAIRMMPKKGVTPEGYFEYTVFPLEGIWDLDEEGRKLDYLSKDHFVYKLMIRQPDFVTDELFQYALNSVREKKPNLPLDSTKFEEISEGLCVQALHEGNYANEPETFAKMEQFCAENNLQRVELTHKEIYISDPRKTDPEKLKTVLRIKVSEA